MNKELNKSVVTKGTKQYHIALSPGDIGDYVLLPGDPARCDMVSEYLQDAKLMAFNREHKTYTGYYKGVRISVTSTGMGCPSTAIAAEELINIGAKVLIRIGSSAAIDPRVRIGDLLITTSAMKNEGTSKFYVPECFPAAPDFLLTYHLLKTARQMLKGCEEKLYCGITSSDDAFYGETPEFIGTLRNLKVLNVDMESSALFTIGHMREVKTATINGASGNLSTADVIYTHKNEKLKNAWEKEIEIVLESIVNIENERFDPLD